MRMNLYEAEIERDGRQVITHVVAPHEDRASEMVFNQECELGHAEIGFSVRRIDEALPADRRVGLEAMLATAPVGFASYCEPIGWIVHAEAVDKLRLFRIELADDDDVFVIAPTPEVAAAIFFEGLPLSEGEAKLFRIHDGQAGVPEEHIRNLPKLLEYGPVGIVDFDEDSGWSLR